MDHELRLLIAKAKARYATMSLEERVAMLEAQKESYVRAEMAFGSDADEAEYRRRMEAGLPLHDTPSGAPLLAEGDERKDSSASNERPKGT